MTLRTKLTLLIISIGVALLLFSTALALRFSTQALDAQTHVYADLFARQVTRHVQALWRSLESAEFDEELRTLTQQHEDVVTIEVFFFTATTDRVVTSKATPVPPLLSPAERQAMYAGQQQASELAIDNTLWIQVLTPLDAENEVVGAVRVRTSVTGLQNLEQEQVYSTLLIAIAFAFTGFILLRIFLDRQINRPLGQLTAGMNKAEAGDLTTRVPLAHDDEIGQLAIHFNRMLARVQASDSENRALLARIQQFNEELESRIAQATHELVVHNRELLRLQREMDRVEPLAALGRVTGAIAHELGTPLNTVLGYCQLLALEALPESAGEYRRIIEVQTRRMADIIRHYLSRTRDATRHFHTVDINKVVQDTLALLHPVFQQHHITVETVLDEHLPTLKGDSASLERVLINILNNAVAAVDANGTISIVTGSVSSADTADSSLQIVVRDSGNGIPAELLPRVFDLFVTTKEPGTGTGLGLALCQEIVKAHGGTIAIDSTVGEGTVVTVSLPVQGT